MSAAYDTYLKEHIANVKKGYEWLQKHFPEEFEGMDTEDWSIDKHDESKRSEAEYAAYDAYFYGEKSAKVIEEFDKAWLHHIHENPHHWQHWILIQDDPHGGDTNFKLIRMAKHYILEMIADWWSFSWKSGNLFEIFSWYEVHSPIIKMHSSSRMDVDRILAKMKQELQKNASNYIIGIDLGKGDFS